MKKAGDLVAALIGKLNGKEVKEYGIFFASSTWAELLEICNLSSAAAHSRIDTMENSVLIIEADHPGWIQLLQTKQTKLLEIIRRRFPDLAFTGVSFRLSR